MKIYTAMLQIYENSSIQKCDVIYYENNYWLVPEWIENIVTKKMMPVILILLGNLKHQKKTDIQKLPVDFLINDPIPKCVFDGQIPQGTAFQIVEAPDLWVEIPKQFLSCLH